MLYRSNKPVVFSFNASLSFLQGIGDLKEKGSKQRNTQHHTFVLFHMRVCGILYYAETFQRILVLLQPQGHILSLHLLVLPSTELDIMRYCKCSIYLDIHRIFICPISWKREGINGRVNQLKNINLIKKILANLRRTCLQLQGGKEFSH